MLEIILIVYTAWAVYSGYQVISGRNEWLDRRAPANIAVKVVLSLVGYFIAAFYLIYLILKFLGFMSKM